MSHNGRPDAERVFVRVEYEISREGIVGEGNLQMRSELLMARHQLLLLIEKAMPWPVLHQHLHGSKLKKRRHRRSRFPNQDPFQCLLSGEFRGRRALGRSGQ